MLNHELSSDPEGRERIRSLVAVPHSNAMLGRVLGVWAVQDRTLHPPRPGGCTGYAVGGGPTAAAHVGCQMFDGG